MRIWYIIMCTVLILTIVSLVYLSTRVCKFNRIQMVTKNIAIRKAFWGGGIVFGAFAVLALILNFVNAIVCSIYFALIWMLCDFVFYVIQKIRRKSFMSYVAGGLAIVLSLSALSFGWYFDHNVWRTDYVLRADKDVENIRLVMFADSHIGTTFHAKGFAQHLGAMQKTNPDVVTIVGDFVDDGTSKEDMIAACQALGEMKTKYGVYFVFGNHDRGYYGAAHRGFSSSELVAELEKNGVKVLRDEAVLIADRVYLIGRQDASVERERRGMRQSMLDLIKLLDKTKYMIVLDHQPSDYQNQEAAGVDLVLSGHTHGGQLFPFSQVGQWIGVNNHIYGHERRGKTDFIVTSGLSNWALKFKTGTKSEFVVVQIEKE